jgi:hypothetical protein
MTTAPDRRCIICGARKPASQFERKGEHIVPRFLGKGRLRTPFVCRVCNGGLGGTVDVALKGFLGVARACFNRGAGWAREARLVGQAALFQSPPNAAPLKDPAVAGAVLKIAYEAAHLRLGDAYLGDPAAAAIREILLAFVNKDRARARGLLGVIDCRPIDINAFHAAIGAPRCDFVKKAIAGKSCLNSIWLAPLKPAPAAGNEPLAVVMDIEGIPPNYTVISESRHAVEAPELIYPNLARPISFPPP